MRWWYQPVSVRQPLQVMSVEASKVSQYRKPDQLIEELEAENQSLQKSLQEQVNLNTQLMKENRVYIDALQEIAFSDELASHVAQKALDYES